MNGIYLVGNYPDRERFRDSCGAVKRAGFDFLEVGLPYNDPVAEGPVISGAIYSSLASGARVDDIIDDISRLELEIPVYVMTYCNIINAYGNERFSKKLKNFCDGVILADLPNRLHSFFYDRGFDMPIVPFATIDTRESDMPLIISSRSKFVYFIGLRGITGSAADLGSDDLKDAVRKIKNTTGKTTVLGFGIKNHADAKAALGFADGFIVGTEAVRRQNSPEDLFEFLKSLL
jgi:tryptophan synthase alpha chain